VKNPQPVQLAPDPDDDKLPISSNDKMLPGILEPELPIQEPGDEILPEILVPEPGPLEEQKIDTSVPKTKKGKEVTSIVGTKDQPAREGKRQVWAVGTDPDHPTNDQVRNSPQATEWAKARQKERDQLVKYRVFTKVKKSDILKDTKIVDTK